MLRRFPVPSDAEPGFINPGIVGKFILDELRAIGIRKCFSVGTETRRFRFLEDFEIPNLKPAYNLFEFSNMVGASELVIITHGSEVRVSTTFSLRDLRNIHSNEPAWILANGPSLAESPVSRLKDSITFSMNAGYKAFAGWGFSTTYWTIVDNLQIEKYFREWQTNISPPTTALFPFEYLPILEFAKGVPLPTYPPKFPDNPTNFLGGRFQFNFTKSDVTTQSSSRVMLGHSVATTSLQLAYWMGCDPIIFLGLDHSYEDTARRGRIWSSKNLNHWSKDYSTTMTGDPRIFNPAQLPEIEDVMKQFAIESRSEGRTIINASAKSQLKAFPRRTFESARKLVASRRRNAQIKRAKSASKYGGTKITIGLSTSNIQGQLFQEALSAIRQFSEGFDVEIIVLDNAYCGTFSHAENMNRTLQIAKTDWVLFIDEDVVVTRDYLASLISCVDENTGAVGLLHWDGKEPKARKITHTGVKVSASGVEPFFAEAPEKVSFVPAVSSACLLVTDNDFRFPEEYEKYFFDLDFCFDLWEKGKTVRIAPHAVFHLRGSGLDYVPRTFDSTAEVSSRDFEKFAQKWLDTGRADEITANILNVVETKRYQR